MGTVASRPSAPGDAAAAQKQKGSGDTTAPCPLGFDKMVSTAADENDAPPASAAAAPAAAAASSCPVKKLLPGAGGAGGSAEPSGGASSGCPVKEEDRPKVAKYLHPHKYNVYSQRIDTDAAGAAGKGRLDPTNNMPANPNQEPAPGQQKPLSTARVPSTIPKGGEESTWTYPSPQMFWNALTRKGKAEDTDEEDMEVVVSIHNNMNELTWKKILEWEKIRSRGGESGGEGGGGDDGSEPRLLRFQGRPNDTAPKALAKMMLGHPLPFDRHDWVVDRGGDERRYVIDYYYDDGAVDEDGMPELHSEGAVKSIKVDVRPALDGFRDFADRLVQMPLARLTGKSDFAPLSLWPSPTMRAREPWAKLRPFPERPSSSSSSSELASAGGDGGGESPAADATGAAGAAGAGEGVAAAAAAAASARPKTIAERDARAMQRVKQKCAKPLELLREAEGAGDAERARAAALKLEYCTARHACKKEARAYREALAYAGPSGSIIGGDPAHAYWAEAALDRRLEEMRGALAAFTERQLEAARRREDGEGGVEA